MPLYEYKCDNGHKFDRWLPLSKYKDPQTCECGAESLKVLSINHIQPDMEAYISPIDKTIIGSRSKHKAHMKEHGVIEAGNEKLNRPKPYEPKGVAEDIVSAIRECGGL